MVREEHEALLERLQTTSSIEELHVWAHELRDALGVLHVMYHTATLTREQIGAFTYSREWAHRYVEMDYRRVDPVVIGALRRKTLPADITAGRHLEVAAEQLAFPTIRAAVAQAMADGRFSLAHPVLHDNPRSMPNH